MAGRTWKKLDTGTAEEIRSYLLEQGGDEQEVKNENEAWRIRFSDSTFTFYTSGTLYGTASASHDPAVVRAWKHIDSTVGSSYDAPTRDFLIGLDETGKGELVGHTVLTGVVFPKELFDEIDYLLGPADTKRRHTFEYWDELFRKLDRLRNSGLDFIMEKVPPWDVDKYNVNMIMDITYQRILSIFLRRAEISQCRIVLDDYGVGPTLRRFLNFLQKQGAEVIVTSKSDERFLEAKTASVISKQEREAVLRAISNRVDFQIDGQSIGSGNAGDIKTIDWLKRWYKSGKEWPWFIKRSFVTVRKLEGKTGRVKKVTPPIREELLSDEFVEELSQGRLSIESLSLKCPACGGILKSARFANFERNGRRVSELRCSNAVCSSVLEDSSFTLRFYCPYVVPDSSAIQRNLISNDLEASRFFRDFSVILSPVVRKECDGTPRGKKEFDDLRTNTDRGRIKVEAPGSVQGIPDDLPREERDERIIRACIDHNAILVTGDKAMSTFAVGKGVFTIVI